MWVREGKRIQMVSKWKAKHQGCGGLNRDGAEKQRKVGTGKSIKSKSV